MIAVLREVGRAELIVERIPDWEKQALDTYDAMENPPEDISKDRPFLASLFHELRRLSAESEN